jgi:hypothetical protein
MIRELYKSQGLSERSYGDMNIGTSPSNTISSSTSPTLDTPDTPDAPTVEPPSYTEGFKIILQVNGKKFKFDSDDDPNKLSEEISKKLGVNSSFISNILSQLSNFISSIFGGSNSTGTSSGEDTSDGSASFAVKKGPKNNNFFNRKNNLD